MKKPPLNCPECHCFVHTDRIYFESFKSAYQFFTCYKCGIKGSRKLPENIYSIDYRLIDDDKVGVRRWTVVD